MSLYNENGIQVEGKVEYADDGKTVKSASGSYALTFFMDDLNLRVKGKTIDNIIRTHDPILGDLVMALRGVGVETTEESLAAAFTLEPGKFRRCLNVLSRMANQSIWVFANTKHRGMLVNDDAQPAFDFLSQDYQLLGGYLSGLSESAILGSFVWGSRQYYSWAHRSYVDDLVDAIGNANARRDAGKIPLGTPREEKRKIMDEKILPAISKITGFNFADPAKSPDMSLFYVKDAEGNPVMLNNILRDLMATQDNNGLYKIYREDFADGYFHNLGYMEDRDNVTDIKSMSMAEKVAVEVQAFFSPKRGDDSALDYASAQYAIPIMADSKNHIFLAGRRYRDSGNDKYGGTNHLYGREKFDFLHDCTNVVLQEYHRIRAFRSNTTLTGQEVERPQLQKTFMKNAVKFCYFKSLNDVEVSIDGLRMPFIKAMEALMSESLDESRIGSVTIHYNGEDFAVPRPDPVTVKHDTTDGDNQHGGQEYWRVMAMEAIQKTFLNPSYHRSMEAWEKGGVFEEGFHWWNGDRVEGYKYLASDEGSSDAFDTAYKQQVARRDARRDTGLAMLNNDYQDVRFTVGEDGVVKVSAMTKQNNQEIWREVTVRHPAWEKLTSYEDASRGIRRGDLARYFAQMGDKWFLEYLYDMNGADRAKEQERLRDIAAEVVGILSQYSQKEKDAFDKARKAISGYEEDKPDGNLLVGLLHEYAWNKILNKMEISQLLVGDAAQFKSESEAAKRGKVYSMSYERCDESAVDMLSSTHKGRLVRDFYGEDEIQCEKWKANQKTVTLSDFIGCGDKPAISNFFNEDIRPLLEDDYDAGVIDPQDFADFCQSFEGMNVTDGMSFRMLESYIKLLNFLHLNKPSIQHAYEKVMRGEKLTWEEFRDAMMQIKTAAQQFQAMMVKYIEEHGEDDVVKEYQVHMRDFVKDSQFVLMAYTEQFARYLGGKESLLMGVIKFARENQIDVIHFESTKKIGESNVVDITDCSNADEAYSVLDKALRAGWTAEQMADPRFEMNKLNEDMFPRDPAKDILHAEPWANVGRQVPTPPHLMDRYQGIGTQIDKLIEADIPEYWVTSRRDRATGRSEKVRLKSEVTVRDDDGKPIMRLSPSEYRDVIERIKITTLLDAAKKLERRLDSPEEMSKLLLEQIKSTNKYSDDVVNMFEIDPATGNFKAPLDLPVAAQALQPILASLIRKQVIKQKTKGGTAIQFSAIGRTENLKAVLGTDEKTGKKYVKHVECMLPAWSKKLFTAFADENGDIDISKIPPSVTSMVGYRVPTEYMYSMLPLRVVGFLEEGQGTSIMLPQEITVWSGSDFDIDKVFLEIPDFKVADRRQVINIASKDAWAGFYNEHPEVWAEMVDAWKVAIAKYVADNEANIDDDTRSSLESMAQDPMSANPDNFRAFRKQWCALAGKGKGRMFDALAVREPDRMEEVRSMFSDYLERNGMYDEYVEIGGDCTKALLNLVDEEGHLAKGADVQSLISNMSQMERDNLLVKLHHSRLTSDFSLMQVQRPGGFTAQKRMARIITILQNSDDESITLDSLRELSLDDLGALNDRYSADLDMFDAAVDDMMFERNMVGSAMIGICALHNVLHAVVQKSPISLSEEFTECYPFQLNGKPMRTRFGDVEDEDGRSILLNIGGFLSASVDNAKDPVLGFLNMTPATADMFLSLLHMGYSIETASLLMNQPVIKLAAKQGSRFGSYVSKLCRDYTIAGMRSDMDEDVTLMTKKAMAARLNLKGDMDELVKDPVQHNALYIVNTMLTVANAIKTLQDANNVTSSNKSLASSPGETIRRMSPALYSTGRNSCTIITKDGKSVPGEVFDKKYYSFLTDDTSTTGELRDTEDYMKAKAEGRISQPFVQACYDVGFRWAQDKLSRYSSQYSRSLITVVDSINKKLGNTDSMRLSEGFINRIAREWRTFRTIDAFTAEETERTGGSIQQVRAAFLRDFPKEYRNLLQKKLDDGRDLQKEFSILRHIVYAQARSEKSAYLKFSKGGKVNKLTQNELTSSWLRMATDTDQDVAQLALNLYRYSFFYNGGNFSPVAFGSYCPVEIISQFTEYMERLRELPERSDADIMDRFVDQFIRNHTQLKPVKRIIGKVEFGKGNMGKIRDVAFDATPTDEKNYYGETKYRYTPKDEFDFSFNGRDAQGKDYLMLYPYYENGEGYLYRLSGLSADGENHWVRADVLGDNNSNEYDPTDDLSCHVSSYMGGGGAGPVTANGALGMSKKAINEAKKVGEETLAKLEELSAKIKDDRDSDIGNNSSKYILDGQEAIRVHTHMQSNLGVAEFQKPHNWTDEQWEQTKRDGTAIGSAIDFYGRTFLDRMFGNEPMEDAVFLAPWHVNDLYEKKLPDPKEQEKLDLLFKSHVGFLYQSGVETRIPINYNKDKTLNGYIGRLFLSALDSMSKHERNGARVLAIGDRVIAGFNGRSIRLFANVNVKGKGAMNVAGEIDWLIAHADGSFSILDMKTVKDSGVSRLQDKTSSTYLAYAKQLNTYRSLLLAMFPKAKVRGLYIVPFVTTRVVVDKNGKEIQERTGMPYVPDASKGERARLTNVEGWEEYSSDLDYRDPDRNAAFITVDIDPSLSGIDDPLPEAPVSKVPVPAAPSPEARTGPTPTATWSWGPASNAAAAKPAPKPTGAPPASSSRQVVESKPAEQKHYQVNEETRQNIMDMIEVGIMSEEEAMRDYPEFFYTDRQIAVLKKAYELGTMVADRIEAKFPGMMALITGEASDSQAGSGAQDAASPSAIAQGGETQQGDGFNSYKEIAESFLGENPTKAAYHMFDVLDGVIPEEYELGVEMAKEKGGSIPTIEAYKTDALNMFTKNRMGEYPLRTFFKKRLNKPNLSEKARETYSELMNKDDDFYQRLADAILNHKRIVDDEGNKLC